MGSGPSAHLAYGLDLGDGNEIRIHERDEYGSPTVDWWVGYDDLDDDAEEAMEDEEGNGPLSFESQIYRRLSEVIPNMPTVEYDFEREEYIKDHFGVELTTSGAEDSEGHVLIVSGSERSVDWSETMPLDPFLMERTPIDEGWDGKLAAALAVLGFTPIQDRPAWLVYPSYG